jgi:hypothetical protein
MKKYLFLAALSLPLLFACGGSSPHEEMMEETVEIIEELVTVLKTITDEETAEAARAHLERLGARMVDVKKSVDELGDLPQDEVVRIRKKFETEMMTAMEQFLLECKRLMGLECLDGDIRKILNEFG